MSSVLDQIASAKRHEVARARERVSEDELRRKAESRANFRDFMRALTHSSDVAVIAEVKKASPSAGVFRSDFDPVTIARVYDAHGAAAISVLTDRDYFQGDLAYLAAVRKHVKAPLLRKDFVIEPYQMYETVAGGADAVLLIAEILPGGTLAQLTRLAHQVGLQALVEVHEAVNLSRALETDSKLIGINNRDLRTFATSLEHTIELIAQVPKGYCVVSESGIRTRADVVRLQDAGVAAILVGESLMRADDPGRLLEELCGLPIPKR